MKYLLLAVLPAMICFSVQSQPSKIGIPKNAKHLDDVDGFPKNQWFKINNADKPPVWLMRFEHSPGGAVDASLKMMEIQKLYKISNDDLVSDKSFGTGDMDTSADDFFVKLHVNVSIDYARIDRSWVFYEGEKKYGLRISLEKDLYSLVVYTLN